MGDRGRRVGAVLASLIVFEPAGSGLLLLGRPRRFLVWLFAGVAADVAMVAGVRALAPRLAVGALVAWALIGLAAAVDTALARPEPARFPGRPIPIVAALFVLSRAYKLVTRRALLAIVAVPGGAMAPTLLAGETVFVDPRHHDVAAGDLAVLRHPPVGGPQLFRRVIAVGGQTIEVRGEVVFVDGVAWTQTPAGPCPAPATPACRVMTERGHEVLLDGEPSPDLPPTRIPEGKVFVLGDHRRKSDDSRAWGPIGRGALRGKPLFVGWRGRLLR